MIEPPPALAISGMATFEQRNVPEQVEFHHPPELLLGRLGHRPVLRCRATGVVVQDVELPEPLDRLGHSRRDRRLVGDVAIDEVRVAARIAGHCPRRGRRRLAQLAIDIDDRHLGAFLDEALGGRAANAAAGAGDERNLPLQSWAGHVRSSSNLWARMVAHRTPPGNRLGFTSSAAGNAVRHPSSRRPSGRCSRAPRSST